MIWKMILQNKKSMKWQLKPRGILRTTLRKCLCSEKFKSYAIELPLTDVITPTTESFRQQLNPLQVCKTIIIQCKNLKCKWHWHILLQDHPLGSEPITTMIKSIALTCTKVIKNKVLLKLKLNIKIQKMSIAKCS